MEVINFGEPELTSYSIELQLRSETLLSSLDDPISESLILSTESSLDFNLGLFNNEFYPIYP